MTPQELIYKIHLFYRIFCSILGKTITILSFLVSCAAIFLIIYQFGYTQTHESYTQIHQFYLVILRIFFYSGIVRIITNPLAISKEKGFWIEILILSGLAFTLIFRHSSSPFWHNSAHILAYILLIVISFIELSKQIFATLQRHLKPEVMFVYSFLFIIFSGALLLMLPNAATERLGFIDALFTSTSAVCVTGLTVVETSQAFTPTGQIILLFLIQIGGIGVMTFTSFLAISFFSQTSFKDQMILKDILHENSLGKIFRTLSLILLTTLIVEMIGAYLIFRQIREIPADIIPGKAFFSIFHSVSAFCNAGFSTLPDNLYNPAVRHLYGLQSWISLLIIVGGIGFPIVFNYGRLLRYEVHNLFYRIIGKPYLCHHKVRIVSTTTRIVITTTLLLVVLGTALFFLFEKDNTLKGMPFIGKLAGAFIGAVSPRTAGFNSVPMSEILPATIFITMLLMWIGASPMSTGGGIKTTAFVIGLRNILSVCTGKEHVEIGKRQLTVNNINGANAIIMLSLLWIGGATTTVLYLEPHATVTQALFEVISALSTVGLSLDFTPSLSDAGKLVISLTMFVGRVGLITILSGFFRQQIVQTYRYADDNVIL